MDGAGPDPDGHEARQLDFSGSAPSRRAEDHQIKLWQQSLVPPGATTVHKPWPLSPPPAPAPPAVTSRAGPSQTPESRATSALSRSAHASKFESFTRLRDRTESEPRSQFQKRIDTENFESSPENFEYSRPPLYVPSPHKLESLTESRDAFRAWPLEAPVLPPPPKAIKSPHKFEAESETRSQFGPKSREKSPEKSTTVRTPRHVPSARKIEWVTEAQDAYRAWPLQASTPRVAPEYTKSADGTLPRSRSSPYSTLLPCSRSRSLYFKSPYKFEAQSETQAQFGPKLHSPSGTPQHVPPCEPSVSKVAKAIRTIDLPLSHLPRSLGVELEGGSYHEMLTAGTQVPARRSVVFTTCSDNQQTVRIRVLARDSVNEPLELDHFELSGIAGAPAGVPQVLVKFELAADCRLLVVSAFDRVTDRMHRIAIHDLKIS